MKEKLQANRVPKETLNRTKEFEERINKFIKRETTFEKIALTREKARKQGAVIVEEQYDPTKDEGLKDFKLNLTTKKAMRFIYEMILHDINERYGDVMYFENGSLHAHIEILKLDDFVDFDRYIDLLAQCTIIRKLCDDNRIGDAILMAFLQGNNLMKEKLRNNMHMPSGADKEKNKPMRLKYGEIYHKRIIHNIANGMGERATKDNPQTAKAEASRHVNDILEKDGWKRCTSKNHDLWRGEYLESAQRQEGNN